MPHLPLLISRFLYEQEHLDDNTPLDDIPQESCPAIGRYFQRQRNQRLVFKPKDAKDVLDVFLMQLEGSIYGDV